MLWVHFYRIHMWNTALIIQYWKNLRVHPQFFIAEGILANLSAVCNIVRIYSETLGETVSQTMRLITCLFFFLPVGLLYTSLWYIVELHWCSVYPGFIKLCPMTPIKMLSLMLKVSASTLWHDLWTDRKSCRFFFLPFCNLSHSPWGTIVVCG